MTVPQITELPGGYRFEWEQEQVQIRISRLHEHSDVVKGELIITTSAPGYAPHLRHEQFNFSSSRVRRDLAKDLAEEYKDADWRAMLEQLSVLTLQRIRQGDPVEEIWSHDDIEPQRYLVDPLIPANKPTVFFGDGGTGKSELSLLLAYGFAIEWSDNPLGFKFMQPGGGTLLLNWETDRDEVVWRWGKLKTGMDWGDLSIHHRRCAAPLAHDLEAIQNAVADTGAKMIIIDSLGLACGGELKESGPAIAFFAALRQIKTTSLIIAHTSKDQLSKQKSIYGSVFFNNLARSVWEVRKAQTEGENIINVGLYHRKANMSKLHRPIGLRMEFGENGTIITSQDVNKIAEFREGMSDKDRILEELYNGRRMMTANELSTETGIEIMSIQARLKDLRAENRVSSVGGGRGRGNEASWGLINACQET